MRTQKSKKSKHPPREDCAGCPHYDGPRDIARDAIFHLRLIQAGRHIVDLYRKFFPKEFGWHGIDYGSARGMLASYDRFSTLVDKNLYPVWDFSSYHATYEDPVWGMENMALCLYGNYHWYERMQELPDLPLVEKLIVNAHGESDAFKSDVGFFLPSDRVFDWKMLEEACDKERGPIRALPTAATLVLGETGNFWLDICEDDYYQGEAPDWSAPNIEYFAAEYAEAKAMKKEAERFFSWVGHNHRRIEKVKRLLRQAWRPKEQRLRVQTHSGKPLVETLGGIL